MAARVFRNFRGESLLVRPAAALFGLLIVQLGLGMATWVTHYGPPVWLTGFEWAANYTVEAKSSLQSFHSYDGACGLWFADLRDGGHNRLAIRSLRLLRAAPRRPLVAGGKLMGVAA